MFGVGSRLRADTRHRLKEELKRAIATAHRVRHWEKKWVTMPDTNLLVYKWVPIATAENTVSASPGSANRRTPSQAGNRPGSRISNNITPRAVLAADESSSSQQIMNEASMNESSVAAAPDLSENASDAFRNR